MGEPRVEYAATRLLRGFHRCPHRPRAVVLLQARRSLEPRGAHALARPLGAKLPATLGSGQERPPRCSGSLGRAGGNGACRSLTGGAYFPWQANASARAGMPRPKWTRCSSSWCRLISGRGSHACGCIATDQCIEGGDVRGLRGEEPRAHCAPAPRDWRVHYSGGWAEL